MDKEKIETILWIFCTVVLLSLTVKIGLERKDYSCDACTVHLQNTPPLGEPYEFGEFVIKDLYNELIENDSCLIKWSPTQGYYYAYGD